MWSMNRDTMSPAADASRRPLSEANPWPLPLGQQGREEVSSSCSGAGVVGEDVLRRRGKQIHLPAALSSYSFKG